ncbi:glycosyltransferase family protein [Nemorincola caseinilytica]|uniref:Glycosyltransferase family protein n=1 Tax=Nemorincola caseinilytica TaxID=2054315 RepID=A0ABP8NAX7_9BACT
MKILFAIQGTGNGHLSRARDVYPELVKHGDVDVLISGIQGDVDVPFPVKYKRYGMSFIFGKNGGVDIWDTAKRMKLFRLLRDIRTLPVEQYDLVINDFEPISAWACKRRKVPCVSLSHQYAVLHPAAPRPDKGDLVGELVLRRYAPVIAGYGFHFKAYGENIYTPVIRREIRALTPTNKGHYTVYLPAYSDETIVKHLSQFPEAQWQVFSKHNKQPFTAGNVTISKIDNKAFVESMASAAGVLCGAGFEGPAEAMYLGKKVLVIPMQVQYEQQCNAAGAASMGASVAKTLDTPHYDIIRRWLAEGRPIQADYPDMTADIIAHVIRTHGLKTN